MKILFTSWDNDLYLMSDNIQPVPRVGEYMRFSLPGTFIWSRGKDSPWMRVSHVSYEYSYINPEELMTHVYLEEIDGDPPFYRKK